MANEKRLIDVNKVIDSMQKCLDESTDKKDSVAYFAFESIIECLKQEPTVDAVEVVRCKDCKHCKKYRNRLDPMLNHQFCVRMDTYAWGVDEYDFCSYGERREGE